MLRIENMPKTPCRFDITKTREVNTHLNSSYKIHLIPGGLKEVAQELSLYLEGRRSLMVTTPMVNILYGEELLALLKSKGLDVASMVLVCSEASKSISTVETICAKAQKEDLDRTSVIIGLGGGVCMDLVTLAAFWLRRGIKYICVPTTLMATVDAGIGIKGAVNFNGKKSYLGCYYPPFHVILTHCFLKTLPISLLSDGFAEIVKMAVITDHELLETVENYSSILMSSAFQQPAYIADNVIWDAVFDMLNELESNFYEDQTYERLVDFGHTFSPLLEDVSGYKLSHGQAVSVDMSLSTVIAGQLGLITEEFQLRVLNLIKALGLKIHVKELTVKLCIDALQSAALHRGGYPNLVLPSRSGGAVFLKDNSVLTPELLADVIGTLKAKSL